MAPTCPAHMNPSQLGSKRSRSPSPDLDSPPRKQQRSGPIEPEAYTDVGQLVEVRDERDQSIKELQVAKTKLAEALSTIERQTQELNQFRALAMNELTSLAPNTTLYDAPVDRARQVINAIRIRLLELTESPSLVTMAQSQSRPQSPSAESDQPGSPPPKIQRSGSGSIEKQAYVHAEQMEHVCVKLHATKGELLNTKEKLACTEEDLGITTRELSSAKDSLEFTKTKHRDTCAELEAVKQNLFATKLELENALAGRFDAREELNNVQFRNKHLEKALEEREAITKKQETALIDERKAHMKLDQKVRSTAIDMKKQSIALYDDSLQILDVIRDDGIDKQSKLNAVLEVLGELFKVLIGKDSQEKKLTDVVDLAMRMAVLTGILNPQ